MSSSSTDENIKKTSASPSEVDEINEVKNDGFNPDKMKIECLCPKCGQKHTMNIYWIGRGTPRKFCLLCKGSIS